MTFNWSTLATLGILSAAIHWLSARAEITRPIWSAIWLPRRINQLLTCPACSGFWIGLSLGFAHVRPLDTGHVWIDILGAGIAAMFVTPIAEAVFLWALDRSRIEE